MLVAAPSPPYLYSLRSAYLLQVNGDPQRGKSQVKAFMAICIHAINRNKSVLDTPYTLLGTVMVAWAKNLQHKLAGSTSRITRASQQQQQPDDEEEDGDEITPDDYEEMKEAAAAWDKAVSLLGPGRIVWTSIRSLPFLSSLIVLCASRSACSIPPDSCIPGTADPVRGRRSQLAGSHQADCP